MINRILRKLIEIIFFYFCSFLPFIPFTTPILHLFNIERIVNEIITPCEPNPCGSNAVCREQNGIGSCQCMPEYYGDPYQSCRPECIRNFDCPTTKACTQNKCADPCPGTCASNAICSVANHIPSCSCLPGYIGDPYRYCQREPEKRKNY